MGEERNPFLGLRIILGITTHQFMFPVLTLYEAGVTEVEDSVRVKNAGHFHPAILRRQVGHWLSM